MNEPDKKELQLQEHMIIQMWLDYCSKKEEVEELKAKNSALRMDRDRLLDLIVEIDPSRLLFINKLTKPGYYHIRRQEDNYWGWTYISKLTLGSIDRLEHYGGCQFIGPIAKPEEQL